MSAENPPASPVDRPHPPATPDLPAQAPAAQEWQRRELVIWGAHSGAGATTLSTWLQPAWDTDPPYPAKLATGRALVIVSRNTAWSATQATKAISAVTRHGGQVTLLAVVSDGWPEPATATRRFALLQPHLAALVRIPFIPALRLVDDPAAVSLPRRARHALARSQAATGRTVPIT